MFHSASPASLSGRLSFKLQWCTWNARRSAILLWLFVPRCIHFFLPNHRGTEGRKDVCECERAKKRFKHQSIRWFTRSAPRMGVSYIRPGGSQKPTWCDKCLDSIKQTHTQTQTQSTATEKRLPQCNGKMKSNSNLVWGAFGTELGWATQRFKRNMHLLARKKQHFLHPNATPPSHPPSGWGIPKPTRTSNDNREQTNKQMQLCIILRTTRGRTHKGNVSTVYAPTRCECVCVCLS